MKTQKIESFKLTYSNGIGQEYGEFLPESSFCLAYRGTRTVKMN